MDVKNIKSGMRFAVTVMDGRVLMEVREVRCGDVWDCYPAETDVPRDFYQPYGDHMVFTTEQLYERVALFRRHAPLPDWGVE